jgi:hypothetical protein
METENAFVFILTDPRVVHWYINDVDVHVVDIDVVGIVKVNVVDVG